MIYTKTIKNLWELLDGKKTYFGVALYFVLGGLLYLGLIDQKQAMEIGLLITAWTGFAMRKAIEK